MEQVLKKEKQIQAKPIKKLGRWEDPDVRGYHA